MMEFPNLRNVNKESEPFDETKRILFLDIDGVLNPFPWQRRWIGPESKSMGMWDPELNNPKNWTFDELIPNSKTHYVTNRTLDYENDRFADYNEDYIASIEKIPEMAAKRFRKIRVRVSDEMLDDLRSLVSDFDLQVVYLTYWKSEALRNLEPDIQLGATSYLDWFSQSDRGMIMKVHALQDFYEETGILRPFAFLDDEATRGFTPKQKLWHINEWVAKKDPTHIKKIGDLNKIPKKLVHVQDTWGISRKEIKELRQLFTNNP